MGRFFCSVIFQKLRVVVNPSSNFDTKKCGGGTTHRFSLSLALHSDPSLRTTDNSIQDVLAATFRKLQNPTGNSFRIQTNERLLQASVDSSSHAATPHMTPRRSVEEATPSIVPRAAGGDAATPPGNVSSCRRQFPEKFDRTGSNCAKQ